MVEIEEKLSNHEIKNRDKNTSKNQEKEKHSSTRKEMIQS
jgi:hypothetical protein